MPIWLTVVVGMVAALLGSAIVGPLRDTSGVDWVELIVQVALAAGCVSLVAGSRCRVGPSAGIDAASPGCVATRSNVDGRAGVRRVSGTQEGAVGVRDGLQVQSDCAG